jgi:2-polyprenyl-3-methyl-5-hydroxy-6-metoxy-1,4-benzoquinol methylase
MSPGKLARKIFGKNFQYIGAIYRKFFVDLDIFVKNLPTFKEGAKVTDIGGGDGAVLNHIINKGMYIKADLIDISKEIGDMVEKQNKKHIRFFPNCSITQYQKSDHFRKAEYILISDVLHHIPDQKRDSFLDDALSLCGKGSSLIIKDIQPGYIKSRLSLLSDKYISCDKNTNLISQEKLIKQILKKKPNISVQKTNLLKENIPNYCIIFTGF